MSNNLYCQCTEPDIKQVNICGIEVPFCKICKKERDESKVEAVEDAPAPGRKQYRCPTGEEHTVVGCGAEFEAEPDAEGLVDCPACGIWFNPDKEPGSTQPAAEPASNARLLQADMSDVYTWISQCRHHSNMLYGDMLEDKTAPFGRRRVETKNALFAERYGSKSTVSGRVEALRRAAKDVSFIDNGLQSRKRQPSGAKFYYSDDCAQLELRLLAATELPPGSYRYKVVGVRHLHDTCELELRRIDGGGPNLKTIGRPATPLGTLVDIRGIERPEPQSVHHVRSFEEFERLFGPPAWAQHPAYVAMHTARLQAATIREILAQYEKAFGLAAVYMANFGRALEKATEGLTWKHRMGTQELGSLDAETELLRYSGMDALVCLDSYNALGLGDEDEDGNVTCSAGNLQWINGVLQVPEAAGCLEVVQSETAYCTCAKPDYRPQTVLGELFDVCHNCKKERKPTVLCVRCDTPLTPEGCCNDETCPFSDCQQDDPRGWAGHPEPPPVSSDD